MPNRPLPRTTRRQQPVFVGDVYLSVTCQLGDDIQAGHGFLHELLDVGHGLAAPCATVGFHQHEVHPVLVLGAEDEAAGGLLHFREGAEGTQGDGVGHRGIFHADEVLADGDALGHAIIGQRVFQRGLDVGGEFQNKAAIRGLEIVIREAGLHGDAEFFGRNPFVHRKLELVELGDDVGLAVFVVAHKGGLDAHGIRGFDVADELV